MMFKRTIVLIAFLIAGISAGMAQKAGIKTNLISDAVTSPNLGVEFKLAPKWTLDVSGQLNLWNIHERRWRHWMVMPEARYWLCEVFHGSFFALHALGGKYNVGNIHNNVKFLGSDFSQMTNYTFEGWGVGAGIGYGYSWILAKHWNIEAEIGIGWIYTRYDKYRCFSCGDPVEKNHPHNYVGPTKLSVAIEYLFK